MKLEIEIGPNLRMAIEGFCARSGDEYNLGNEVRSAFGLNFGGMVDSFIKSHLKGELKEIVIKVE